MSDRFDNLPSADDLKQAYKSQSVSDARAELSQLVEQVAYRGEPVLLTKHDKPRVALVPLALLASHHRDMLERAAAADLEETTAEDDELLPLESLPGFSTEELAVSTASRDVVLNRARAEDLIASSPASTAEKPGAEKKEEIVAAQDVIYKQLPTKTQRDTTLIVEDLAYTVTQDASVKNALEVVVERAVKVAMKDVVKMALEKAIATRPRAMSEES